MTSLFLPVVPRRKIKHCTLWLGENRGLAKEGKGCHSNWAWLLPVQLAAQQTTSKLQTEDPIRTRRADPGLALQEYLTWKINPSQHCKGPQTKWDKSPQCETMLTVMWGEGKHEQQE